MGKNDGKVIGTTLIYDSGDPAERFNLVLVSEGYKQSELGKFADDAQHFVDGLFDIAPFDEFQCAINVYRVDVSSTDSGADDPTQCGGTGAMPKTFFDAKFCTGGVRRALTANSALVLEVAAQQVPQFHSAQLVVNSPIYGGTGGQVGVSSTATHKDDGTPVDWREIIIHEMGHSIFGLADEYEYYAGCTSGETGHDNWAGGEPSQANVTASTTANGKWSDLINTSTLPTTTNGDCSKCDPQPSPSSFWIGTFEGAKYYHCGLYRPMFDCKMRKLDYPFCAVCARVIREHLAPYDPWFCAKTDLLDPSRWAIVATILFGVIQDGGGVIIVGGKPIPIDPWGPLRHSLWGALADPIQAPPAMRDVVLGIALREISSLVSSREFRAELERMASRLVDAAAKDLPAATIR
ncbi:MAG TPA: M64 family metallopeptidase [Chloroflexia bacterium]|nr:M64 family metallopeptidase [Chloroflexia bacterium]